MAAFGLLLGEESTLSASAAFLVPSEWLDSASDLTSLLLALLLGIFWTVSNERTDSLAGGEKVGHSIGSSHLVKSE